jgi:ABC-type uncharacterized transport system permease subunit
MNHYQILAVITMVTLASVLGMTTYILVGKHSVEKVYRLAGLTLVMMLVVTVLCTIIYRAYHIG